MTLDLSRRMLLIGTGATLCARAAVAQAMPTVGVVRINAQSAETFTPQFLRDMAALGWEDGRTIRIETRYSDGRTDLITKHIEALVARDVQVLVVFGNLATAEAQRATQRIPIVAMNDDMVGSGLVASWTRPGGNTTGLSVMGGTLDVKRLELLHELVPTVRRMGALEDVTLTIPRTETELTDAARRFGIELIFFRVKNAAELPRALDDAASAGIGALNVLAAPMLNGERALIIERARQARLPAIFEWPETAEEGGLMGYGARLTRLWRQVAVLTDKILRGANPAEIAIEQPAQLSFVINLKTARELGLTVPATLLGQADDVVE